jgi:hypothetical protein
MRMNEQTSEEFDWSPLGEAFWLEAQKTCGASDLQTRFACCRVRGMTAVGSARAAGYTGDNQTLRQAGSRAAQSTAVMNLLALAKVEAAGGDDGTVGVAEARRILSRLARGSDPNVRIKAIEGISKLDRDERANRPEDTGEDLGEIIRWFHGLFRWVHDEMRTRNPAFDDLWRAIVVRIGDHARSGGGVTKPGGNGAQASEPAGEASDAAAA